MEKTDNMYEQIKNFIREMKTIRKNQMEGLEIKIIVTKMKNAFDELINRFDTAEERISKLEDRPIDIS